MMSVNEDQCFSVLRAITALRNIEEHAYSFTLHVFPVSAMKDEPTRLPPDCRFKLCVIGPFKESYSDYITFNT